MIQCNYQSPVTILPPPPPPPHTHTHTHKHTLNTFGAEADIPLRWRHNGRNCVSNHQPHDCLLNRLFGRRSKKASKLRVTGLCAGNSPGTGEFAAQMASNAEYVSIWWRHHANIQGELMRHHVVCLHGINSSISINYPISGSWNDRK